MAAEAVTRSGPAGCPVLHGFDPMEREQVDDPATLTAIARTEAPVFFSPELEMYVVTRHADVSRVMAEPRTFVGLSLTEREPPAQVAHLLPNGFIGRQQG